MATLGRFCSLPEQTCLLLGPRGTGKTTWLRTVLPDATFVNLLEPETHRELLARPERLREMIRGGSAKDVVIDELQRAPELLTVVHDLIESPNAPRFVLTGSSARKLRRGGVDLLGGRAVPRSMHPFMAAELPSFSLEHALTMGLVPLVAMASSPTEALAAYASLYLEQEVQAEGLVRNIGNFARFLEAVSFSHGSVINLSSLARETQVNRKTAEGYLEILEDLLVAYRLPVFTRRAGRQLANHPKFYLFDAGVFRSVRPRGPLDRTSEIEGAAFEGLVAQHLRAWIAYGSDQLDLKYWRTRSGVEVDFVIYGQAGFWAIEVKNSTRVRPEDLRGLRAFLDDYPEARAILLYRGKDRLQIGQVDCIPVDSFLRNLRPGSGLTG